MIAFLIPYNRMADYVYHLSKHMLAVGCRFDDVDHFIGIVATIDLSATHPHHVVTSHVTR